MTRILTGTALAAIFMASAAFAATPATHTASISKTVNYGARCSSLADQWKTAEAANSSSASLGKAKADAEKGAKLCGSKKASDHKRGASDYEAALKLLGVTPT
jgi:hypothetical protein